MNHGIETRRRLRGLRPILNKWVVLNRRLGCQWSIYNDAPWWHIERALVSVFAGAVWRCGGDAFEEYAENKRGDRRRASGRIDLWFLYRGQEFKAEAKQCWVRSDTKLGSLAQVERSMKRARRDAGNCAPDGIRRLAIVFGVALVLKRLRQKLPAQTDSLVELAKHKSIDADAVAWVFPKLKRPLVSSDGFILPGIIVWLKLVPRSPRK